MKLSCLVLAVFALLAVFGVSDSKIIKPKPKPTTKAPIKCTELKMCTNVEQPIWASDGKTCELLLNKCYLYNENCLRAARNEKALKETTHTLCKRLCKTSCDNNEINLQCGQLKSQVKRFMNSCDMQSYICKTGEYFKPTDLSNCGLEQTITEIDNPETTYYN